MGINFEDIDLDTNDAVKRVMEDFDTSSDVKISKEEFIEGHSKWLNVAMSSVSQPKPFSSKFVDDFYKVNCLLLCRPLIPRPIWMFINRV